MTGQTSSHLISPQYNLGSFVKFVHFSISQMSDHWHSLDSSAGNTLSFPAPSSSFAARRLPYRLSGKKSLLSSWYWFIQVKLNFASQLFLIYCHMSVRRERFFDHQSNPTILFCHRTSYVTNFLKQHRYLWMVNISSEMWWYKVPSQLSATSRGSSGLVEEIL